MEKFGFTAKLFVLAILGVTANAFIAGNFDGKKHSPSRHKRSPSASGSATITKFHVTSRVTTRYACAYVTSVVRNDAEVAREVGVEIRLPDSAFISNFSMEIEGNTYVGKVKEKAVANAEYQRAVSQGQSAGVVKAKTGESQTFEVSVNVAAGGNVTFRLEYQELLKRKLGVYNHVIYANPGQIVDDFSIEVYISEPSGISLVEGEPQAKKKRNSNNPFDVTSDVRIRRSATQAYISYRPSTNEQRNLGQFNVKYDVTREKLGGELLIRNGYFVHFFAPNHLPEIPKKIVFVIDRSGSMQGRKIKQTKQALLSILDELTPQDRFNIITFSHEATSWHDGELVSVNERNIENAKHYVRNIGASGGTNLDQAAQNGVSLLESVSLHQTNSLEAAAMMIILTDGQPTEGVTSTAQIRSRLQERVVGRYSVFCLGFGSDVDHGFLDQLATENQGVSRQIYEDSDANLQLTGFYAEVASPMLAHVIINYTGMPVNDVSKSSFDNFFDGSEILVVGRYGENPNLYHRDADQLQGNIGGDSVDGKLTLVTQSEQIEETFLDDGFSMEKIWAYLTVKQLLREKKFAEDERKEEIDARVLDLSIRHNFVTDLTSMVVIKPNETITSGEAPAFTVLDTSLVGLGRHRPRTTSLGRALGFPATFGRALTVYDYAADLRSAPNYAADYSAESDPVSSNLRRPSKTTTKRKRTKTRKSRKGKKQRKNKLRKRPNAKPKKNRNGRRKKTPRPKKHLRKGYQMQRLQQSTTPTLATSPETSPTTFQMTSIPPACGGDIKINASLNVTSPMHPGLYPPNSACVWNFTKGNERRNSTQLRLTFESLDIEDENCSRDRVLVYSDSDQDFETFCGFDSTLTVVKARDRLVVKFLSDDVVQGRGFVLNLQVEDFIE